jgi:predicted nucleic acid-binding protein
MKALIDTNVLVDGVFAREPFYSDAKRIFQLVRIGKIEGYVSVQSLKDIFYISGRSYKKVNSFRLIEDLMAFFHIIGVTDEDARMAIASKIEDFEDGLLAFSAARNGIRSIITRNNKDYYNSDMVVINPKDIVDYLPDDVKVGCVVIGE